MHESRESVCENQWCSALLYKQVCNYLHLSTTIPCCTKNHSCDACGKNLPKLCTFVTALIVL